MPPIVTILGSYRCPALGFHVNCEDCIPFIGFWGVYAIFCIFPLQSSVLFQLSTADNVWSVSLSAIMANGIPSQHDLDCHSHLRWNFHLQWICQVWWCTILVQEIVSWEFTAEFCHMKNSDHYLVDPQHHLLLFLAEVSMVGKYFLMEERSLNNPPSDFVMVVNSFSPPEWIWKIVIFWSSLIGQHCQKCFGLHIAYNTI